MWPGTFAWHFQRVDPNWKCLWQVVELLMPHLPLNNILVLWYSKQDSFSTTFAYNVLAQGRYYKKCTCVWTIYSFVWPCAGMPCVVCTCCMHHTYMHFDLLRFTRQFFNVSRTLCPIDVVEVPNPPPLFYIDVFTSSLEPLSYSVLIEPVNNFTLQWVCYIRCLYKCVQIVPKLCLCYIVVYNVCVCMCMCMYPHERERERERERECVSNDSYHMHLFPFLCRSGETYPTTIGPSSPQVHVCTYNTTFNQQHW